MALVQRASDILATSVEHTKDLFGRLSTNERCKKVACCVAGAIALLGLWQLADEFFGPKTKIRGAVIVITGGAQGIGKLMVDRFLARGARLVYVCDLDVSKVPKLDRLRPYQLDVSDNEAVKKFAASVTEDVDILVLNAGIANLGKYFWEEPVERGVKVMQVNCFAHYYFVSAFLPRMRERNSGHIVSTCSAASQVGGVKLATYCASKSAAALFLEGLRYELRQTGSNIACTVVNPYYIAGPSTKLFEGAKTTWMWSWLLPVLADTYVADNVIYAIRRRRRLTQMPRFIWLCPAFRLIPPSLMDVTTDLLGIHHGMKDFKGKDVYANRPTASA